MKTAGTITRTVLSERYILSGSITDRVYTHTTPEKIILEAEKYTDAFDKIYHSAVMKIPSDSLFESEGKLFIALSKGKIGGRLKGTGLFAEVL